MESVRRQLRGRFGSEGEEEELRLLDNIPLGRDKVELPSIGIAPMSKFSSLRRLTFHEKELGLTMVMRGFWMQNVIKPSMNVLKSSHTTAQE